MFQLNGGCVSPSLPEPLGKYTCAGIAPAHLNVVHAFPVKSCYCSPAPRPQPDLLQRSGKLTSVCSSPPAPGLSSDNITSSTTRVHIVKFPE